MGVRLEDLPAKVQAQALEKYQLQASRKTTRVVTTKYHNKEDNRGNLRFDSKKEARRFDELLVLQKEGQIRNLRLQQDFTLQEAYTTPSGERVRAIRYRADFCYEQKIHFSERTSSPPDTFEASAWTPVVEDVKSKATKTKEYSIKRKLMLEKYNIKIREI